MSTPSQRLQAIDALRGLVILIMMVDHVRETFYLHQQVPDPPKKYILKYLNAKSYCVLWMLCLRCLHWH